MKKEIVLCALDWVKDIVCFSTISFTDAIISIEKWLNEPTKENERNCYEIAKRLIGKSDVEKAVKYALYIVVINNPKIYNACLYGVRYYTILVSPVIIYA